MKQTTFPRMHVSTYVSDLEKTTDFYSKFFNQPPSKTKAKYAKYELEEPSLIISFIEKPDRVQSHFGHLGFQVASKEELESRFSAVKSTLPIDKVEMGSACCYAVQDKFWVVDPDGIQWEVYYFHQDTDFNDPHYDLSQVDDCACTTTLDEKEQVAIKESCCGDTAPCC